MRVWNQQTQHLDEVNVEQTLGRMRAYPSLSATIRRTLHETNLVLLTQPFAASLQPMDRLLDVSHGKILRSK